MEETNRPSADLHDDEAPRLLAAIRSNPETARVLAGIALGGDPVALIAELAPPAPPETPPPPKPSCPAFLDYVRESFWQ